jgi:hypothetical protein
MYMDFPEGRSNKAAQLHSIQDPVNKKDWSELRKTGHEKRGGDDWISRGQNGTWHRQHSTPRVSLFTPYKVAKGPKARVPLSHVRFTYGTTESGKTFEFHDDWTLPSRKHYVLEEPWVGYSIFTERSTGHENVQGSRVGRLHEDGNEIRDKISQWHEVSDDE